MSAVSLYLASRSPRRREILDQIGVLYDLVAGDIDETPKAGEAPETYVTRMASEKARAGLAAMVQGQLVQRPVLAADTSVVVDVKILGKPADREEALAMLTALGGREHQVMSAVAIADGERLESRLSVTRVLFSPLSEAQIARYWETGEPQDKAGAYGIQGLGGVFVRELQGSYSGVVGLPIAETVDLLDCVGVPYWQ
ncbi:Maf family protein [Kistimonas asteriae]|uniref:Maf family protein n=1 Tax=Kistimonas asteriae TaxID=517724 RepID=UPI001BA661D4|nr:Maf family protein [Kistimonas asteriae]